MTRQLRLFYAFRLLATSYLFVPIFILFQATRGLSFFDSLALGGIYSATVIAVEVPTGVFADRLGRRRAMLLGALAMVASCVIAANAHGFAPFAVAEALAAMSMALCSGADSAYLYDLLRGHGREDEYAKREAVASAWHLAGSAIAFGGGGLLAELDLTAPYYATAAVAAIAALIAIKLHDDRPLRDAQHVDHTARAWRRDMVGAVGEVLRNGRLAWLVGYSAVVFVLLRATIYVYQPYLTERGLGAVGIGLVYGAASLVAAACAYHTYALRRRFGDELLLWGLLAALAASFVGLAGAGRGPWLLALLGVQAIANGVSSPLTKPLLNREISDSSRRAAILSVESMARRAGMGVFAPLAGLYGEGDVMMLCGVVGIAGFVVLALARRTVLTPSEERTRLRGL